MAEQPYVIAEIGSNHGGEVETAKSLIDMAALAGANAVKFQKRDNATLFTQEAYNRPYTGHASYGETYGKHREALELGWEEFQDLKRYAQFKNMDFFVTPFDIPSVEFLEELGVDMYKVASASVTNHILLERIAKTGKYVIMSAGGQSIAAVDRAVDIFENNPLTLMHCVAAYPCPPDQMNLSRIIEFKERYPSIVIGLSDHQDGIGLGAAAYALGARVFEKHITLDHSAKGTDHAFSLEYEGLRRYVKYLRNTQEALIEHEQPMESELAPIAKMAQSLYWKRGIDAGIKIKPEHIAIQSPGGFMYPTQSNVNLFVGKKLGRNVSAGEPLDLRQLWSA